jgi:DNA-binding transcriptional regulator YhcF (GntR family)
MVLKLDFSGESPIYRQIHDQMVMGIAGGKLRPGEKLPTVRALAVETGVNAMTVNKAYQTLKAEGYIVTDRRGGTAVAGNTERADEGRIFDAIRLPAAEAKLSGMSREEWLALCGRAFDGEEGGVRE